MASPIMIPITFFILKLSWLFVLLKSRGFLIFVLANQASNSSHVQSTIQRYNKNEILPHLSVAKRGYICQSSLSEVIQCILYKLKTGCQWYMLPVSSFFTAKVLHCKTVYGHFRMHFCLTTYKSESSSGSNFRGFKIPTLFHNLWGFEKIFYNK